MGITVQHQPSAEVFGTLAAQTGAYKREREDFIRNQQEQFSREKMVMQNQMDIDKMRMQNQMELENRKLALDNEKEIMSYKAELESQQKAEETDRRKQLFKSLNIDSAMEVDPSTAERDYSVAQKKDLADINNSRYELMKSMFSGEVDDNSAKYINSVLDERESAINSTAKLKKTGLQKAIDDAGWEPVYDPSSKDLLGFNSVDKNGAIKFTSIRNKKEDQDALNIKNNMEILRMALDASKNQDAGTNKTVTDYYKEISGLAGINNHVASVSNTVQQQPTQQQIQNEFNSRLDAVKKSPAYNKALADLNQFKRMHPNRKMSKEEELRLLEKVISRS